MRRRIAILVSMLLLAAVFALPAAAQNDSAGNPGLATLAWITIGMAIAAAGCGIAQSNALRGACEGVARNPGASDTIRLFLFLGLALIEFLALLTFVVCFLVWNSTTS